MRVERTSIKGMNMNIGIVGSGPSAVYAIMRHLASEKPQQITVFEAGDCAGVERPTILELRQSTLGNVE
jgi:predicted NAD/FAD-binding protein